MQRKDIIVSGDIQLRGQVWPEYDEDIPLSAQQRKFVEELAINGFNATAAADAAGYKWPHKYAYRLMADPKIKAAIDVRFGEFIMSANEAMARLTDYARGEGANYLDDEGNVDFKKLREDGKMHLVKSITDGKYGKRVEFYSAIDAIKTIGKYHNVFVERNENINIDLDRLSEAQLQALAEGANLIEVLMMKDYENEDVVEGVLSETSKPELESTSGTSEAEEGETGHAVSEVSEEI